MEPDTKDKEENLLLGTIRGKCVTQLLLLGAIDSIQVWIWLLFFLTLLFIALSLMNSTFLVMSDLFKTILMKFCTNL